MNDRSEAQGHFQPETPISRRGLADGRRTACQKLPPMNILVAHNSYKQAGGEDQCVAAEIAMLRAYGHNVIEYRLHNESINQMSHLDVASRTIWSLPAFRELRHLFRAQKPQIAHFHNTFPLISPAAYYAAHAENVRVVQTLHNFRLCCSNAILFRDGKVCEACLGKSFGWPGIVYKCYRNSRVAAATVAGMVAAHRMLGTWQNAIHVYIALSEFSRLKLVEGGLPADKVVIKSNFAYPDPGLGEGTGRYAVFVGRLSVEKGVEALLKAWRHIGERFPLKIIGDGPLATMVREAAARDSTVHWLGNLPLETVYNIVGGATFLVLPSQCYENFPRVIIEAFAKGTPVIVSKLGAMAEIVQDGHTGLHFRPGDPVDLADKVRSILADPLRLVRLRQAARQKFDECFTADVNYRNLAAIYVRALDVRHAA
jgi:glycosyltransferase involved in cell wall biosynthesis